MDSASETDWVIEHHNVRVIGIRLREPLLRVTESGRWMYTAVGPEGPRYDPPVPRFRHGQRFTMDSAIAKVSRLRRQLPDVTFRIRNLTTGDVVLGAIL